MANIVRINGLVVDLEQCAIKRRVDTHGAAQISLFFQQRDFLYTLGDQTTHEGYMALDAYINAHPPVRAVQKFDEVDREEKRRRKILESAFDPFLNDDQVQNVYSLFADLPDHDYLLLCLESEDGGQVRERENFEVLFTWSNIREAIDRFGSYRDKKVDEGYLP